MPALVAHIIRDLEDNCGCIDLMHGGNDATRQLRMVSDWDGEERLFEVSPPEEGLHLPSELDTPDRYWHVVTLDLFGEPDQYDDQKLYVQIQVAVGFVLSQPIEEAAVVLQMNDGEAEHRRLVKAPLFRDANAWDAWIARAWPRVNAHADRMIRHQVAEDQLYELMHGGDDAAFAA